MDQADLWARLSGVVLTVNWYRRDCAALGSTSPRTGGLGHIRKIADPEPVSNSASCGGLRPGSGAK